ncbi:hypothetical protein AB0A91_16295 [Streptomyces sp. NPDC042207]|uniref:hypothetical protein n=1 Tax=Streptomyces sp. NPDC042207 TaxID=3154331 RepID=UPI0033F2AE5E
MTAGILAVLALVLALPAGWCLGYRTRRQTAATAERAARPPGPHAAAVADEITLGLQALAEACCLPAALTAGADHDPDHCTRKDTTT